MKAKHLLLIGIVAVLSSCSSAYKLGQTPDDVYYSPAPPDDEYVTTYNQQDKDGYAYNNDQNMEDLAIRRGINDPYYRNDLSFDLGSGYVPYDYYGSPFYSPYTSFGYPYTAGVTFYPYTAFNYFYPSFNSYYYQPYYFLNKRGYSNSTYAGPRQYNLGVYNNISQNRTISSTTNGTTVPVRTFKPQQPTTTGIGGFVRRVFTPSDNSNNNSGTRTFRSDISSGNNSSPARSSGSSGGGSGGGGARSFRH